MFDMRYHIASLVAVFLALAVGIILGTVISDKGVLVEQQKSLAEKLEKDFERLRTESAKLMIEVQRDEQFVKESIFPLIKDKLSGQNVAVVITSPIDNKLKRSIFEIIQRSGATYSCITLNLPWNLEDKALQEKILPIIQPVQGGGTVQERLVLRLADFYSSAPNTPTAETKVLQELAKTGVLGIDVMPAVQPTAVLVIGGSDGENTCKEVDGVFIDRLKANKVRVVGAETTVKKISYMNTYQRSGIPTIDNIDEGRGQLSTVLALAGASGNFGIKPTANQLIPTLTP